MKLVIRGSRGEVKVDWANYALLRDNIQHFMEAGRPSQKFPAIHGLERAVDRGLTHVDAARLRGELLGACYALRRVHLQDGAVSLRTHAFVTKSQTLPYVRGTTLARLVGWSLPSEQQVGSLIRSLKPLILDLLAVTETAVDGDRLTVTLEAGHQPPTQLATWQANGGARQRTKLRASELHHAPDDDSASAPSSPTMAKAVQS